MAPAKKDNSKLASPSAKVGTAVNLKCGTPPAGRKSRAEIQLPTPEKKKAGWYITSTLLDGLFEIIFITKENMVEDAYVYPLVLALSGDQDGNKPPLVTKHGLIGAFRMRVSLADPKPLYNGKSNYARKAFLRMLDGSEDAEKESRLAALQAIKSFLTPKCNNRYEIKVMIEENGWDLTPLGELPKLDHYLQHEEIIKVIKIAHAPIGNDWAVDNSDAIKSYFSEGHIPFSAHAELGVPLDKVMNEYQF
jgi:hypothetical protein